MLLSSLLSFQPLSWVLGLIDLGAWLLRLLPGKNRPKFFSKGWGDLHAPQKAQEAMLSNKNKDFKVKITYRQTQESNKSTDKLITLQQGSFRSPLADYLPAESKTAYFFLVQPSKQEVIDTPQHSDVFVIMMPATGEMGKRSRLSMAKQLAREKGWTSIILTAPYYAQRKPPNQCLFLIDTVADLLLQSQAIIQEASALACHFLQHHGDESSSSSKVCITGFSWGAAMSACVAATTLLYRGDGKRLACVPYVGSASPVCLADGVLTASIDWQALCSRSSSSNNNNNNNSKETKNTVSDEASARMALYRKLNDTQLSVITEPLQRIEENNNDKNFLRVLRPVCAQDDHFIRRRYVKDFVQQLGGLLPPRNESPAVTWLGGGHATAMFFRSYYQKHAVVSAVEELLKSE